MVSLCRGKQYGRRLWSNSCCRVKNSSQSYSHQRVPWRVRLIYECILHGIYFSMGRYGVFLKYRVQTRFVANDGVNQGRFLWFYRRSE